MSDLLTAERVSRDASDNFVFQRSLLAYAEAAGRIGGDVLEIGTGSGYGIAIAAPRAKRFVTLDKEMPELDYELPDNVEFLQTTVPPLPFASCSFDCVISFQVIEHIRHDVELVREMHRVLRPGGRLILTTPNAPRSLTRNPWHVREYCAEELENLLASCFTRIETMGIAGNERVAAYYERNRAAVERLTRWDIFDLQHRLPRQLLQLPYDWLNRRNRRRLLAEEPDATTSIRMEDYRLGPFTEECYDLFVVAEKGADSHN